MKKISLASAACVLALAVAAPSIASAAPGKHTHKRHHQHQTHHKHQGHHGHHAAPGAMKHGYEMGRYERTGFFPIDLAGGVIVGAATIATAPFVALGGPTYAQAPRAHDMGYASWGGAPTWQGVGWNGGRLSADYAKRNGMACVPGAVIKSKSGRPTRCQ